MSSGYLRNSGDLIADYKIRRLLGAGMEGHTYLVRDVRDGAQRTLKILRGRNMMADAKHTVDHLRRFTTVPSVKRFREWGVLQGQRSVGSRPWLAFDFIDGTTLAQRIGSGNRYAPLSVLLKVCDALTPIHRRGLAVGDFDMGRNILVERGTGLFRFCDLDAGGPMEPPPRAEDDIGELARLAQRMWRVQGETPGKNVIGALESSTDAIQAARRLRRLSTATAQLPRPDQSKSFRARLQYAPDE